ncbi:hypothetical protein [Gilvimarinus chinensis]|uniref:hypothetical protein n=1 Tax=Gilvimarinus chinensis TaxID=396005 RepID=UPI0012F9D08A|nr:hypothetical protein [Gilvimarinus chinensis]
MNLKRLAPCRFERWREEVERLSHTVNDPDMFDRIKEALLNRRAFFFESEHGIAVLKPCATHALAWVAISSNHCGRIGLESYFSELEFLAQVAGSPALQFWTTRKGFTRICQRRGYQSCASEWRGTPITVWEKPLCLMTL